MVELKDTQLTVLVDKLPDIANVAAGSLLFGQFLGGRIFSLTLAFVGVGIWVVLTACAVALAGRKQS